MVEYHLAWFFRNFKKKEKKVGKNKILVYLCIMNKTKQEYE